MVDSGEDFQLRSSALWAAVEMPMPIGKKRSAQEIRKDAEVFYGFLSARAATVHTISKYTKDIKND